jgi:Asp-tRNA(Asn)/Glu-tRNA(Gln) amidotransferase A subunit family amidase
MSGFDDYGAYDALGLADLVRRKEVSAEDLLEAAVARIEATNPAVNAVVQEMYDEGRRVIAEGVPEGPFSGVPYLLKDLVIQYKGARTSNGSRLFADLVAEIDFELTTRLRAAGQVVIGKTNTPELGMNASTEPVLFGPTRNPWNLERTAGGSSGGAAAAVAAGMVPAAHATDAGGSIRIPAAVCGVFGLKPTRARNPMGPWWARAGAAWPRPTRSPARCGIPRRSWTRRKARRWAIPIARRRPRGPTWTRWAPTRAGSA